MNHLQGEIFISGKLVVMFFLHFSKTRWVVNEPAAVQGIQIWENVVQVVKYWLSLSKSKSPRNSKSFDSLVKYHTDKLMISELHFFKYIASILRPVLFWLQASKPVVHFFAVEFDVALRQLTSLVAKCKIVSEANTLFLPVQLDLGKNENFSDIDMVELGSAVMSALANLKKDCAGIVLKLIAKFKERCPLKYPIARNDVCLSPLEMIRKTNPSITRAKRLTKSLYELKLLCTAEAEQAKQEYLEFMSLVVVTAKEKFC